MVLSLERWVGKVAVVTGTSAGIGVAIADQLVGAGLKVVGLARRVDRVEELAKKLSGQKGKLYPLKCDISKEDDILNAFKWIEENVGPVSILVNNAGITGNTNLIEGKTEIWKNIFDVNVLGLCIASREAVKSMKKNNIDGHIIQINSIEGHEVMYMPFLSVYPASKFAVTALTETLRKELIANKLKIKVTSVSPGAVRTEIMQTSNVKFDPKIFASKNIPILEPEDIADAVTYALSTPPHVQRVATELIQNYDHHTILIESLYKMGTWLDDLVVVVQDQRRCKKMALYEITASTTHLQQQFKVHEMIVMPLG